MDLNDLKVALTKRFNVKVFVNDNNTLTVYNVNVDKVRNFVNTTKFRDLVHDVAYDYDYGYDDYCDPLTVAKDRVVLYCYGTPMLWIGDWYE